MLTCVKNCMPMADSDEETMKSSANLPTTTLKIDEYKIIGNNTPDKPTKSTLEIDQKNDDDDHLLSPTIMRQLTRQKTPNGQSPTPSSTRQNDSFRFTTVVGTDTSEQKEDSDEIFEYAFGEGFSYWKGYDYFPFIKPKHKNMKDELLRNEIKNVSIEDWDNIAYKAKMHHQNIQNILGAAGDTNTPYARYNQQFNEVFGIPFETLISEKHIMSILFYTDLTDLPRCMKAICRKSSPKETNESFMKRHSELTNWLRLISETILLYGNYYGKSKGRTSVYHGLNRKFYFTEFKAKFFTPTSTTTELSVARSFAEDTGIILELGPMESRGDMYFDTCSLSQFPDEREYLFFWAELPIKTVFFGQQRFDMAPLSLYQSIVSGNIVIDKDLNGSKKFKKAQKTLNTFLNQINTEQAEQQEKNDDMNDEEENKSDELKVKFAECKNTRLSDVDQYGYNLLKRYIRNNKNIRINKKQIIEKITYPALRKQFIEQNDDKSFKRYSQSFGSLLSLSELKLDNIADSQTFTWTNSLNDLENFVDPVNYTTLNSRPLRMKSEDRAKFYCQMEILHENKNKIQGRISLVLWKLKKGIMSKTVCFDLYCKQLDRFYVRFHDIEMKLGGDDHECRQGAGVDIDLIHKAIENGKDLEWKITIG